MAFARKDDFDRRTKGSDSARIESGTVPARWKPTFNLERGVTIFATSSCFVRNVENALLRHSVGVTAPLHHTLFLAPERRRNSMQAVNQARQSCQRSLAFGKLAGDIGFEPIILDSESSVLPLHQSPAGAAHRTERAAC